MNCGGGAGAVKTGEAEVNSQRKKKEGWGRLDQNAIFQNSRDLSVNQR
jgi:hypothetical protein